MASVSTFFATINYIDVIALGIVLWTSFHGFRRGLIQSIFDVIALVAAVTVAIRYTNFISHYVKGVVPLPPFLLSTLAFVLLWIVSYSLVVLLGGWAHKLIRASIFGPLNFMGGGLFGFLKGAGIVVVIFYLINVLPLPAAAHRSLAGSWAYTTSLPYIRLIPQPAPPVPRSGGVIRNEARMPLQPTGAL